MYVSTPNANNLQNNYDGFNATKRVRIEIYNILIES